MKKFFKSKIVWTVLLLLVVFAGLIGFIFAKMPKRKDGDRVQVTANVVGVYTDGSYAWLIRTAHGAALIDAGMDREGKAILAELAQQHLSPQDVHTILITHGHRDHVGALSLFPRAKIWVGPRDAELMRNERRSVAMLPNIFVALSPKTKIPDQLFELAGVNSFELDGNTLTVIHVPGHTPGSTMFLYQNILFTGDSLFVSDTGLMFPPSFICDNSEENHASLAQLKNLSFDLVADGHAGFTDHAHDKLVKLLQDAQ